MPVMRMETGWPRCKPLRNGAASSFRAKQTSVDMGQTQPVCHPAKFGATTLALAVADCVCCMENLPLGMQTQSLGAQPRPLLYQTQRLGHQTQPPLLRPQPLAFRPFSSKTGRFPLNPRF
jgi:hypothetical protein